MKYIAIVILLVFPPIICMQPRIKTEAEKDREDRKAMEIIKKLDEQRKRRIKLYKRKLMDCYDNALVSAKRW